MLVVYMGQKVQSKQLPKLAQREQNHALEIKIPYEHVHIHEVTHYENTPIEYTVIFHGCKKDNF